LAKTAAYLEIELHICRLLFNQLDNKEPTV